MQFDSPQISVSQKLFLSLVRENPELRLERSGDGTLTIVPLSGGEDALAKIAELGGPTRDWNPQDRQRCRLRFKWRFLFAERGDVLA